jgi:ribonuclease Z
VTRWLLRIVLAVAALALLAVVAFRLFERPIAEAAFRRAVQQIVGRDRSAELPDGLHVYVCGAGSPMPDPHRAGPCLGVIAGSRAFIFDTGSGGVRNLSRMGFPVGRVERVYLTHLHSDHIDGLGETMLQAWVGGSRKTPLPVSGPRGTAQVAAGFNAAYRIDSGYRTAHHGAEIADPNGFGLAAEEIELPREPGAPAVVLDEAGLVVTATAVDHTPIDPAFGYRIDYRGRSVAFSGDTIYHEGFVAAARGVDVLFHEALQPTMVTAMSEAAAAREQTRIAKLLSDILDYHATPEDAARAGAESGAREVVLYHIVPPLPARLLHRVFLGDAEEHFDGPIEIAEDGLLVSLPAGGDEIRKRQVLR